MAIAKNQRVYGKRLGLMIDGKDYWADISEYRLEPDGKGDPVTFGDAQTGASPWKLRGKAIQSTDAASFWTKVWEAAGKTVAFVVAPHGNKTATASQPHFKGMVTIGQKPAIGTEAGEDKGALFDFEWDIVGEPDKVVTGSTLGAGALEGD